VEARNDPSPETYFACDLHYVQYWSLWMDTKILLKTVFVVFQGTGS
jgi:lipopolysaccharide/colanic/teichoic acid biosynthesis glycosyltransferase